MSAARAITIGAFDGVHRGHAALIEAARSAAGDDGQVVAVTFEPHPLRVLRGDQAPPQLSNLEQRTEWLQAAGADEVVTVQPTRDFLGQSPRSFLEWVVEQHKPSFIVEGPDFRFGYRRAGSNQTLREHEGTYGYRTIEVADVEGTLVDQATVRITSSLIRWLVRQGRVRDAGRLLGRAYELRGKVVPGDGRGRAQLGVSTANLDHGGLLLPADGIYAGVAKMAGGREYAAAVSIGTKPTFGEHPRVCEAHLIGYEPAADEYGWTMKLLITDWLRDQITYDAPGPLINQIHRDIERVKRESAHESVLLQHHD